MTQQQIMNLPDEIILEILMMTSNSIPTLINFGMTCSSMWELLSQRGELLWTCIIERMASENLDRFKSSTLSLLDVKELPGKCKRLMRIVRYQYRFELKNKIVCTARKLKYQDRVRYLETMKFDDEMNNRITNQTIISNINYYSPENFARKYRSMAVLLGFLQQNKLANFTMGEVIDCLFMKRNAHKQLDPKNRRDISRFYEEKKEKYSCYNLFEVFPLLEFAKSLDDALLFLKFIYLECPIVDGERDPLVYRPKRTFTGLELDQEKQNTHFLDIMHEHFKSSKRNWQNIEIVQQALSLFKEQVYGSSL